MIESILNLLAPVKCVYCGAPKILFCDEHLNSSDPTLEQVGALSGYFAHQLDDPLLAALSGFKDRSMTALAQPLARAIEPLIATSSWIDAELIVIPPSTPKAYRSRGFVPVKLILRNSKNQLPVTQLLLKRRVKDQRSLDAAARQANLSDAYRARDLSGKKVLLFDDVLTTSATLHEMQRAVLEAGGVVTGFCVLARRFANSGPGEKI
jgi:predicted amidophosphoribosyltransferase